MQEQIPTPTLTSTPVPTPTPKEKASTNPSRQKYALAITVKSDGHPVTGATVELHSTPMKAITDENGIARFSDVERGNHTVFLAYQGYSGQEKIIVDGDKQDIAINITIQLNPFTNWIFKGFVICIAALIIVIIFLVILLKRRKKSANRN